MLSEIVKIKCGKEFKQALQAKAREAQMSVSEFVRVSVNQSVVQVSKPKWKFATIAAVNKLGNNLNQIARKVNQSDTIDDKLATEILNTMLYIERSLMYLLNDN